MPPELLPTLPPSSAIRANTSVLQPDEQWKADLRKRIERDLLHMVEDAQIVRDAILNSQPSESSRERAQRDYEETMDCIRTLAQDEFTRMLRQEMSERKRAVDVADFTPFDAPQNAEGSLFTNPQDVLEREPLSDESSEDGYGTGGQEDEDDRSGELDESADEGEDGGRDEGDPKSQQSRPPSRPSIALTQTLLSKSAVSRRDAPSRQRQSPNLQSTKDNDDDDTDAPHRHSPGGAPPRQSSDSQASIWRAVPRAPEPPIISLTPAHASANGQESNTRPVQVTRRGSVNSTGSAGSSTGRHRAGSLNSDQYRSNSVAPRGDTERPSALIAASMALRHDRPSPSSYASPTRATIGARRSFDEAVRSPLSAGPSRAVYGLQRSLGQTTPEEGPGRTSWSSLNSRRSFSDLNQTSPEGPRWTPRASLNLRRSFGDLNQTTPEGPRGTSSSSINSRRSFSESNQTTLEEGPGRTSWSSLNSRPSFSDLNQTPPEEGSRWAPRASLNLRRSFGDLNQTTPERLRGTSGDSLNLRRSFSELNQTTPDEGPGRTSRGSLNSRRSFGDMTTPEEGPRGTPRGSLNLRSSFGDLTTPEEGPRASRGSLNLRRSFSRTTPDVPLGPSWAYLNSRRAFGDSNVYRRHHSNSDPPRLLPVGGDLSDVSDDVVGHLDDRQAARNMRNVRGAMSIEQMTAWWESEARRKEEETTRKEEEASRKEEEARRLEEKARQSLEEAKRLESNAQQAEASAKIRETAARNKEAKVKRKEAEVRKREADAQKREAEAQRREESIRYRELESRLKEEQARRKEEAAQRKEDDARKREEEVRRKEEEAGRKEEEASRKEEDARRLEEKARQSLEEARRLEVGARYAETSAEKREADADNEEAEEKRDEIEVNFFSVTMDIRKN